MYFFSHLIKHLFIFHSIYQDRNNNNFHGYSLGKTLYRGNYAEIRQCSKDSENFSAKIFRKGNLAHNEYETLKILHNDYFPMAHGYYEWNNYYIIVMQK